MKKLFIHNTIFRVIAPLLYGILVYVLILLVNDSVESLNENFINQEVLLCIGLTYLMVELFRIQVILLDKYLPIKSNILLRIPSQIILSLILAYLLSSLVISLYFQYILEYSRYETELLTFNVIYIISALLFNLLYISVAYLNMENDAKLEEEEIKRKNLEYQMRAFNNEINPNFLYASLETLIGVLYENEEDSEQYIEQLSNVYRHILSNKNNELVSVKTDLASVDAMLFILNIKHQQQLTFTAQISTEDGLLQLVPGTFNLMIEKLVNRMIINKRQAMKIKCYVEDDYLVFQTKLNEKLTQEQGRITESLKDPYQYFTIRPMIELKAYGDLYVKIPLVEVVVEEELMG